MHLYSKKKEGKKKELGVICEVLREVEENLPKEEEYSVLGWVAMTIAQQRQYRNSSSIVL